MADTVKIPGELESVSTGNKVVDVANVKDKTKGDKSQFQINAEHEAALSDRYTKEETYNKKEVEQMVTPPNPDYKYYATYADMVAETSHPAGAIYRVSSYDGTQVDATSYAEYTWNGSEYKLLAVKSQVNEVFDISAYHATGGTLATYADLAAALDSNNGGGVPQSLQKGGMSIKFVQTSDNKYIQVRLIDDAFTTDVNAWQIMDLNPLNREVLGNFTKGVTWSSGYVNYQGDVMSSAVSQFTQPFLLKKGETVTIGTRNTNITIIGTTQNDSISVGDNITPIQRTSPNDRFEEYSYTAQADIKIVLCVTASEYTLSFYNSKNSSYMLNNMDDEPTEDSQMLVKSGGVYNAIVNSIGYIAEKKTVSPSQLAVILNKHYDFGENIAVRLKTKTCTFASGKSISVSLYKSNGSTIYSTLSSLGETIKRNAGDGVTFTGIYAVINSDVVSSSGELEIEVFWKDAYYSMVITPNQEKNIEEIKTTQRSDGRELIYNTLAAVDRGQEIGRITHSIGNNNNVAIRIIDNQATLASGTNIKATLYSGGSAFASLILSEKWKYWQSSLYNTQIDAIIVVCDGEVSDGGNVCVEIAYGDYFRSAVNPIIEDFGTITLDGVSQGHPQGTTVTKMFDKPLPIDEFSKIVIKSSEFVLGSGSDDHPSIYVYGIYSQDGQEKRILPSLFADGKISPVYAYTYKYLYGIYFWNSCAYSISFDASVVFEDTVSNIPSIIGFDNSLQLPRYYNDYIEDRKKLIRGLLKKSIINGDTFYFVTDTHWEYNQRNSPAIIKSLSELCIPKLFHGGDMYHEGIRMDKFNTKCLESYRKALGSDRVFEVDGNHEYYMGLATYGDVFAETRLLLNDVVFGGNNKNYYYIDDKSKKARYIVLYVYGNNNGSVIGTGFQDEAQMSWLKSVALNVEEGYSIFIFAHYIYSRRPQGMPGGEYSEVQMLDPSNELNFYRIINEYNGNGTIVACITGHTHWDCISQNKCSCPIICTTSDHNYPFYQTVSGGSFYDFMDLSETRDSGTIKEQAFDTVIYDKDNSMLHLVRIGSRAMNRNNAYDGNAQVDIRTIVLTNMEIGNTITLNSEFVIAAWESSDNSLVSVSDGVVTANADGYVVITGTASDGKKQSWFIKIVS